MSDLYDRNVVTWSVQQAERLRRLARGERVNDVDWANVIEEIESVGRSEILAVRSALQRALEHLLTAAAWPGSDSARDWLHEAKVFLADAKDDWTASMDQALNVGSIYARARRDVSDLAYREGPPGPLPPESPYSLRDLLRATPGAYADAQELVSRLRG